MALNGKAFIGSILASIFLAMMPFSALASEASRCVQASLANLGFEPGPADGVLGRRSSGAAAQFRETTEMDFPDLTKENAQEWCDELKEFQQSPLAMSMRDQTAKFVNVKWNGVDPTIEDGTVTFFLQEGQCGAKVYPDGRGESDCNGGRLRTQIMAPRPVRVGQNVEYYMEFFVPEDFNYRMELYYPSKSRLLIAEWTRIEGIKNHIYEILVDNQRGVTFERETCILPEEFGQWHTFSLRINWSKGEDGYLEARCNDRLVLERRGDQTVVPPDCASGYKLQCDPSTQRPNASINWNVGPNFSGYGSNYAEMGRTTPFAFFPKDGIEIKVRNLYVGEIVN